MGGECAPNLRGASPVGRDDGGPLYAARSGSKGENRIGDVDGVWRSGMTHSRSGVASASRPRKGQGASSPMMGVGQMVLTMGGCVSLGKLSRKTLVRRRLDSARLFLPFFLCRGVAGVVHSATTSGRQSDPEIHRTGDGNGRPGWEHQIRRWASSGAEVVILAEGGTSSWSEDRMECGIPD